MPIRFNVLWTALLIATFGVAGCDADGSDLEAEDEGAEPTMRLGCTYWPQMPPSLPDLGGPVSTGGCDLAMEQWSQMGTGVWNVEHFAAVSTVPIVDYEGIAWTRISGGQVSGAWTMTHATFELTTECYDGEHCLYILSGTAPLNSAHETFRFGTRVIDANGTSLRMR